MPGVGRVHLKTRIGQAIGVLSAKMGQSVGQEASQMLRTCQRDAQYSNTLKDGKTQRQQQRVLHGNLRSRRLSATHASVAAAAAGKSPRP